MPFDPMLVQLQNVQSQYSKIGQAVIDCSKETHHMFLLMPRAVEFCTQEPLFEGEEVFGSQKRKACIPLGFEHES